MKVVINKCYGGFGVSTKATMLLRERGNQTALAEVMPGERYRDGSTCQYDHGTWLANIDRSDPQLIKIVEDIGDAANGDCAELRIVEIPDGVEWEIQDYDGMETVRECSRTWG